MITIMLTEGATKPFQDALTTDMVKAIKHFESELISIRSGRAHPSMVESIKVSCYGGDSELPLKNLASITVPEARTLLIQPWDQGTIPDIEKAIASSDAGLVPVNDGNVMRIQLQELSHARREELIKLLGKKLEDSRIAIRNVRKQFHNFVRDQQTKEKTISEDFGKRLNDLLDKETAAYIKKVEELAHKKETELKG